MKITVKNPLINGADVPDPAIIRVGNAYYMVSTTMYFCPAAPVMKSFDLVNWKIISYCAEIIEDLPNFRLEIENEDLIGDYGRGQWASSIRFYNDKFWVIFTNNTTERTYIYNTSDPEKTPWQCKIINRKFYDPSLFQDTDGKFYIFHGYSDIYITEMLPDLSGVKPGGLDKLLIPQALTPGGKPGLEGSHAYFLNGYYYLFCCTWGLGRKTQHVYRSKNIDGPFEERMVFDKQLGGKAVAQGGIIDVINSNGNCDWYGFFFKEPNASGRVPALVPMCWSEDDWPVFGDENGNVPEEFEIEINNNTTNNIESIKIEQNIFVSDEFDFPALQLAWQWNHNPDNQNWSLTERPGFLRLRTGKTSKTIYHARNTLTQRVFEPLYTGETFLDASNLKNGDIAGLVLLQAISGFVGIEKEGDQNFIVMYTGDNDSENHRGKNAIVIRHEKIPFDNSKIYLRINCNFRGNNTEGDELAVFEYSLNGTDWNKTGKTLNMQWTLRHFTGARIGLFNYATKETGGYADFDYYRIK